jgi:hypothetical protein
MGCRPPATTFKAHNPCNLRRAYAPKSKNSRGQTAGLIKVGGALNYAALLQSALVALLRNKMRSILTVLGITIGIAAVICVVAIGKAGQARVEQQLNNLGDNFVWIEAGGRAVNGVRTGTHDTKTLVVADAVAIKNQISLIKSVSPNVDDPVQVVYGNQNWHTSYRGVSPEYFEIKRWFVDQGAFFSQDDVDRAADVCVLGRSVRDQLFGVEDPIHARLSLRFVRRGSRYRAKTRTTPSSFPTPLRRRNSKGSRGWTTSCARRFRRTR